MGRIRAKSIEQNINEYRQEVKEYKEGKREEMPVPLEKRPLRPVKAMYQFIDDTDLMRQVSNDNVSEPNVDSLMKLNEDMLA